MRGSLDELSVLLEAGANINQSGEDGYTPLHWAALLGHLEVVKYLTATGASRFLRNDDGETPLEVAQICGEPLVADLLQACQKSPDHNEECPPKSRT